MFSRPLCLPLLALALPLGGTGFLAVEVCVCREEGTLVHPESTDAVAGTPSLWVAEESGPLNGIWRQPSPAPGGQRQAGRQWL
mmetsp:Transcript_39989/g.113353  ORF Transcript_39989/g.113353 Transcript_39989/m.113353 type:complete len:83 (+) Transcript_39989:800-1048(+)